MFLDASVIVALLAGEPEADEIADAMADAPRLLTSPVALFEALARLAALHNRNFAVAQEILDDWLREVGIQVVPVDAPALRAAQVCAARYHHLTGHPARLNMGDCLAYGVARTQAVKLAFKGDDFVHTDVDAFRFGS
jgi:ribonuclease VapC